MRNRFRNMMVGGATVVVGCWLTAVLMSGQAPPSAAGVQFPTGYKAPRAADGRPDLSGIYQALTTANIDIQDHEAQPGPHPELLGAYGGFPAGQGIVEGGEIPYRPDALAKKKQNVEKRMVASIPGEPDTVLSGDPELKCFMPGVPRMMYMPYAIHVFQTPGFVLMTSEFNNASRIVRMNWKEEAPIDSFMGWSRGHWEGETLVVDVTGFRDDNWFDRAGNHHSDALHVIERYTALSPYHLQYEATMEDPKVFTRPWKTSFPMYRRMEKNVQLMEYKCVPFVEELIYGRLVKKQSR